jgi:uncharacterized protein YjbI with pentapeptide repeats
MCDTCHLPSPQADLREADLRRADSSGANLIGGALIRHPEAAL